MFFIILLFVSWALTSAYTQQYSLQNSDNRKSFSAKSIEEVSGLIEGNPSNTVDKEFWRSIENYDPNNQNQIQHQFDKDILGFLETLFPSKTEVIPYDQQHKINILKRIFILLKVGRLQYTTMQNGQELRPWSWPLAVALGHGQRVVVELKGVSPDKFYQWLTGSPLKNDRYKRGPASHGFQWKKIDDQIRPYEIRLGVTKTLKNIKSTLKGKHHGINLPIGGLGNEHFQDGFVIGEDGFAKSLKDGKLRISHQHGHLYIHTDTYDNNHAAILLGIEPSAPGAASMHGDKHNALSAFKDTSTIPSIFGGVKMAKLFPKGQAPAANGGMRLIIDQNLFSAIQNAYNEGQSKGKEYFKKILSDPVS